MTELRWILLAAGAVLVLAIWLSGRRQREAASGGTDHAAAQSRAEPAIEDGVTVGTAAAGPRGPAANPVERAALPVNPPVVEISPHLEPELESATAMSVPLAEVPAMLADDRVKPIEVPSGIRPVADRAVVDSGPVRAVGPGALGLGEAVAAGSMVRHRPASMPSSAGPGSPAPSLDGAGRVAGAHAVGSAVDSMHRGTGRAAPGGDSTPTQQRIVALRVMAGEQRWPGAELITALQAEGLTFGRYSIFHRQRDDGRCIYSVASMVEPGSFDLSTIETQSFPGISLFAVLPGPLDAPTTFDQMLAMARRLADRLSGNLQDEHGSSLTAQRVLNLREELVHFEHLLSRRPKRP